MLDTLRFWLDRGTDGFRADVVHLIGKGPRAPGPRPLPLAASGHRRPAGARAPPQRACRAGRLRPGSDDRRRGVAASTRPGALVLRRRRRAETWSSTSVRSTPTGRPTRGVSGSRRCTPSSTTAHGRSGCWATTTSRGSAPASAPTPERAPLRSCCSPSGARRTSMPARSSVCRTHTSRRTGSSTRVAETAAEHRCRGRETRAMAGGRTPGSPSSTMPRIGRSRRSATIPTRSSTSTARCWSSVARRRRCGGVGSVWLDAPDNVLAWRRVGHGDDLVVLVNFSDERVTLGNVGDRLISSVPGADPQFDGTLLPDEAVIVRDKT